MKLALKTVLIAHILFVSPHHAPVRRTAGVAIHRADTNGFVGWRRASRLGGFEIRLFGGAYTMRVVSQGRCFTTQVRLTHRYQRLVVRVPTKEEYRCEG